jgi:tripartite-type tricarboxylate transporter receptor subunit TctC
LTERLGWQIVPENRPGGNFVPMFQGVSLAPADGHQIMVAVSSMSILKTTMGAEFDFWKDLIPLTRINTYQNVLVANNTQPYSSLAEFVKYAKSNPGKISYGSSSLGGWTHLIGELFQRVGNQIPAGVTSDADAGVYVKQLRILGVFGNKRDPSFPDVPATGELGIMKDVDVDAWLGFAIKAGTPRDITQKLFAELNAVLKLPETAETFKKFGVTPVTDDTPEKFAKKVLDDTALWAKVIKDANLKF